MCNKCTGFGWRIKKLMKEIFNFCIFSCWNSAEKQWVSERWIKKHAVELWFSSLGYFMRCLEKLCALHSNGRKQNVNFRLNLDEMCSLLTWGPFHLLCPPLFMGTLNLFQLSLRRQKNFSLSPSRRCLSPSVVLQLQYPQRDGSACLLKKSIAHLYYRQNWK